MYVDSHSTLWPEGTEFAQRVLTRIPEASGARLLLRCRKENVIAMAEAAGIKKAVTWVMGGADTELCRLGNEWLARTLRELPGRFLPMAVVNPHERDSALAELDRRLENDDFVGLKLHPIVQGIALDHPNVKSLIRRAAEYEIPVVMHIDPAVLEGDEPFTDVSYSPYCRPELVRDLVDIYDSPRLICAHGGGLLDAELPTSRVSFQTTGISTRLIEHACRTVGAGRILFGSDFPFYEIAGEVEKVRAAVISDEEKDMILRENAVRVFGSRAEPTNS